MNAQTKTIDSLKLVLKNAKHDTTRCGALISLGENVYGTKPDTALLFWFKAKKIAELNIKSESNTKDLTKIFLTQLATIFNNIAYIKEKKGDFKLSLEYYFKSLKIRNERGDLKGVAISLNNIGFLHKKKGELDIALEYYNKSLKIREVIRDEGGIAESSSNIGRIYDDQGDIKKALEYLIRSLKISESIGDETEIANSLNNLGVLYRNQKDFTKALECFTKNLRCYEKMSDNSGIATTLMNLGAVYNDIGDNSKTVEYYNKALKKFEEIDEKSGVAIALNNLGAFYGNHHSKPVNASDISTALYYYQSSLTIYEQIQDKPGIALGLVNVGAIYLLKKNYSQAIMYCSKSLQVSKEIGYPSSIQKATLKLHQTYKALGNYKLAMENYELFIQMRDSISNEKTKKASIKSQLKYEYEKKAAADSVKNAEGQKVKDAQLQAQNAQIKNEKFQRYALITGLAIVILGLGFVINRFRITQKQKKIIEEQKLIVDEAFHKLAEKNKEVMDSIHYAKRIQTALMTNELYIQKSLSKLQR